MAKVKDEVVMEVVTRGVAENIHGERYLHEDAAVSMAKSGLNMGKDLGNIEMQKQAAYVGLAWMLYGGAVIGYQVYKDDIKEAYNKIKQKWNDFRN